MTIEGWDKLQRKLREIERTCTALEGTVIKIGFFSGPEASLAEMHEFGNVRIHLPERPAFRAALRPADLSRINQEVIRAHGLSPDLPRLLAIALFEHIRDTYLKFEGAGGPTLSAHLEARVNGQTVARGA